MARKIIILCGSPRRQGNTNTVVNWVADGAREVGADVEIVDVAHLHFKVNGCTSCMGCQSGDKFECVVDDDATPVLRRLPGADVLVFATPVYFFGPSAQLKLLMDRMFCLIRMDPTTEAVQYAAARSDLALIATAGGDMDGGLGLVEKTFQTAAQFLHQKYQSLLVPKTPHDPQELADDDELRQKAVAFGQTLGAA